MTGRVPLEEVYGQRLEIIAPLRNQVATIGRLYIESTVPQARDVFAALLSLGKDLHVVSGGLRLAVFTFAAWLGLRRDEQVHAVKVWFDNDNRYRGYDRDDPLTRSGGKREVLESLPPARTAFVGDGITDAETKGAADVFICFAGVVHREEVAALADVTVETESLAGLLPVLCTAKEIDTLRRDPRYEPLLARAYAAGSSRRSP
jgi:phosphoserine phosphatase